jgi:hypothetical protein
MNLRRIITAAIAAAATGLLILVVPALAHHASTPFYDPDTVVDLEGSVTRFVFRNPHAFLFIDVEDGGQTSEWQVELGAPVGLRRVGWTPESLPVGMIVKLTGRKSRADGSQGVCCVRMTREDGSPIIDGGAVRERTQN